MAEPNLQTPILQTVDLVKRFGGLTATDMVSLTLIPGELHAIIGPNGAGKTTLLSQLSGELRPTSGRVMFEGRDVSALPMPSRARLGMVRSFQITSICMEFSTLDNVAMAVQARSGHSFRFWKNARNDRRLTDPAMEVLRRVGLGERAHIEAGLLAHGEQRQLEVAIALATEPKVLLLDEPMAGMGREESSRMVEFLQSLKRRYAILLIEHDMDAVFALADRISVLVYGKVIATGLPAEIRANPQVRHAYLGDEAEEKAAEVATHA
jgi:branched-chain amino acid transport system ATP-binding protein